MANSAKFFNRELSWLEFNQRVLDEARNPAIPLLERLKFLAITASNADEFFMVRVGGLQVLSRQRNTKPDPAGMTPDEQLLAISKRFARMTADQYACFATELEPALQEAGIHRLAIETLNAKQQSAVRKIFEQEIFPVLTPIAVTSAEDFPTLSNQGLSLCVRLAPKSPEETQRVAVIPLGRSMPRFFALPSSGGYSYMLLEDVAASHVDKFFTGEQVLEWTPFRITRNADMSLREDQAPDLLASMEEILDARKDSPCVRLEIAEHASAELRGFLQDVLTVADTDVIRCPGPVDLSAFMQLGFLPGFDDLKYEAWPPQASTQIDRSESLFDTLTQRDVLLYHPYESFDPVVRLLEEAADDPDVLAIKQVLYRTSRESPIVAALARAASNGKNVTALIELKARFDEARNIEWAKNLEQEGVHVIYGVKNLKTHAKICLIVRRESHGIQRYMHFGTGNYNEATARIYSDASLMTSDEELGADATAFFNMITGYSQPQKFRKIEAAPIGLRDRLLEMIEAETQRVREGGKGSIQAKINSLVDPTLIKALYEASDAGVKIQLNIRGICCLRPGVKGLSDNIEVLSIIDRYLEHARIFHFLHGGDNRVFISSADWMPRNLDKRVELLIPVEDDAAKRRLMGILDCYFRDNVKAKQLQPNGSYQLVKRHARRKEFRSQEELYRLACEAVKNASQSKRTVFEPHQSQ
ncbi:polyphosphate kinase 1 [Lignipirellula cremea]|nr:polyphosphate kinase 1 [Lignipirellula cremea]